MICDYLTEKGCEVVFGAVGEWRHLPDSVCNDKCNPEVIKISMRGQTKVEPKAERKPIRDKAEQERLWEICELCDNDKCQRGRLDRRIRNGHCPENKWSK